MLVSVIERRREIGIRMAVGARRKDIQQMFWIEAVVLTLLGGLLGVILGTATTLILALSSGWEYSFHLLPAALGFIVSAAVGVFSVFILPTELPGSTPSPHCNQNNQIVFNFSKILSVFL